MKITQSKLRRIIRKTLREGAHEKLTDDATGGSTNEDQVLHFALTNDIEMLCMQYQQHYAKYGVTEQDILEEIKLIVNDMSMTNIETFSLNK